MKIWVTTPEFKNLNIGCAFDEGSANETEFFSLFYGERTIWGNRYITFKDLRTLESQKR